MDKSLDLNTYGPGCGLTARLTEWTLLSDQTRQNAQTPLLRAKRRDISLAGGLSPHLGTSRSEKFTENQSFRENKKKLMKGRHSLRRSRLDALAQLVDAHAAVRRVATPAVIILCKHNLL